MFLMHIFLKDNANTMKMLKDFTYVFFLVYFMDDVLNQDGCPLKVPPYMYKEKTTSYRRLEMYGILDCNAHIV